MGKIFAPEIVRNRIRDYANRPTPTEVSEGKRGAIVSHFDSVLKTFPTLEPPADKALRDFARYLVWGWVLGDPSKPLAPMHSADLWPQAWAAFGHWCSKLRDGEYKRRQAFAGELAWILHRANFDYQQGVENPEITLGQLIKRWADCNAHQSIEITEGEPSAVLMALRLGGVITAQLDEPVQGNGGDIPWCNWCGDRPAAPGIPCQSCQELGAKPGDGAIATEDMETPDECICADLLNCNPDPVPNPDCRIHGALRREAIKSSDSKLDLVDFDF